MKAVISLVWVGTLILCAPRAIWDRTGFELGIGRGVDAQRGLATGTDTVSRDSYLSADAVGLFLGEWWVDRIQIDRTLAGGPAAEKFVGCEHWFVFGRPGLSAGATGEQEAQEEKELVGIATGTVMRYDAQGGMLPEASIEIRAHSQNESEFLVAGFVDAIDHDDAEPPLLELLPFLDVRLQCTWYSKTRFASGRWQLNAEHGSYELLFSDNNHFSIHLHVELEGGLMDGSGISSSTLLMLGSRATTMEDLRESTGSSQLKQYAPIIVILALLVLSRFVKSKTAVAPRYKAPVSAAGKSGVAPKKSS
ncbi:hypothetical protein FVE85_6270 [Porphyridium purpureum]|uniref:DOMON domain-containing protein n=1 Tax=Porphyridium purpureum TaxID=35688 RepID=A0A5J4Z5T3_PORPP|nr:hypothetical protein FVE85_6270 [Porphyridium purpureum]|eukprot:POR9145..scf295_1